MTYSQKELFPYAEDDGPDEELTQLTVVESADRLRGDPLDWLPEWMSEQIVNGRARCYDNGGYAIYVSWPDDVKMVWYEEDRYWGVIDDAGGIFDEVSDASAA